MQGKNRTFSALSNQVIGSAIEVHRHLGPGLLESAYGKCYAHEFQLNGIAFEQEFPVPVNYKGVLVECGYYIDFFVGQQIIVELKAVAEITPVHQAQLMTYMKLMNVKQGFLINFNVELLKNGLHSFVL